jgi:hypothetical protein
MRNSVHIRNITTLGLACWAATCLPAAACTPASDAIWGISVAVGVDCGIGSTNTAEGLIDLVSNNGLQSLAPTYTNTSAASIELLFNSLPIDMTYQVNSTVLNFSISALGVSQQFAGGTRDESQSMLRDYLKHSDVIGQIMNYQAKNSPNSPITGQAGLIPFTLSSEFDQNFTNSATNIAAPSGVGGQQHSSNLIGVGASYSDISARGISNKVYTIPLSYTIRNDIDPRRQLVFSLPITEVDVGGAKSFHAGAGISYRYPMNDNWTLTPSGRYSVVGSADMATVAALETMDLTSTYIWLLVKSSG